jgi:hypothetical protein
MNTHNIYPFIIIIFSVLIFFALVNNERNKKFNIAFEKFINNGISFTPDLFNGYWTSLDTIVNSKGQASNLIEITKNELYFQENSYSVKSINGRILTAINSTNNSTIQIKIINAFSNLQDEDPSNQEDSSDSLVSDVLVGIVLVSNSDNKITNKFAIYKLDSKGYLSNQAIPIIQNKSYIYKIPKPLYNMDNYFTIVSNNYKYPENLISFQFGETNTDIFDKLTNKYNGTLRFSIQRVYRSPLGGDIITRVSKDININAIQNLQIPTQIIISPFDNDKILNNITNFDEFSPKYTILYFYKITNTNQIFRYNSPNLITANNSEFKFKNNANSMFKDNVAFNDFKTATKLLKNVNSMVLVGKYNSNASSSTIINFSVLNSFL